VGIKVFAIVFTFPTTLFYLLNLWFVKSNDTCKNSLVLDLFPDLDGLASANCDIGWGGNCIITTTVLCCLFQEPSFAALALQNRKLMKPKKTWGEKNRWKQTLMPLLQKNQWKRISLVEEPAEKDAGIAEELTEMDAAVTKEPAGKDAAVPKE
jgi:hypothetical protein